jgi:hypothetical protein
MRIDGHALQQAERDNGRRVASVIDAFVRKYVL